MMKKLILTALIIGAIGFHQVSAQDIAPGKGPKNPERKEFVKDLNLTKEQAEKMKIANEDRKTKVKAVRAQNLDKKAQKEALKKINNDYKANLATFLSQEQRDKLEVRKEQKKAERKARKG